MRAASRGGWPTSTAAAMSTRRHGALAHGELFGAAAEVLAGDALARYEARAARLAPPGLRSWLHR